MFAALHLVHLLTVRRRSYLHSAKPGAATRNLSGGWKNDHYHRNCDCLNCSHWNCGRYCYCGRYYRNRRCGRHYILHTSCGHRTNPSSSSCRRCNLRCSRHTQSSSHRSYAAAMERYRWAQDDTSCSLRSYAAATESYRSAQGDTSCSLRSYAAATESYRSAQGDTSCWSHSGHSHKSCWTHFAHCREASA